MKQRSAFTMVELIFVIVIIGILASVGIPKLSGTSDNAKKTAEMATISAVSTAIESVHGEWSINEDTFTWGITKQPSTTLDARSGYPININANNQPFGALLKGDSQDFTRYAIAANPDYTITVFTGPASNPARGVKFDTKAPNSDITGKPDRNDFWIYASYINPTKTCTYGAQTLYSGDFILIDVTGAGTSNYAGVALNCN